jgi:glycosyltransferase involved in cell wall biosynthesis
MTSPLVTVICLCYNHERFVEASIRSVLGQNYPNIEIIVVDDHSSDGSVDKIKKLLETFPDIKFLPLSENYGNCKAFNKGLAQASGDFVIDLATDDLLLPDRVSKGVLALESSGQEYGVNFSNAAIINEQSIILSHFYSIDKAGKSTKLIPQGDLYAELVKRYFICPPTMMSRRSVFEKLIGYDENLAYEDFDFWVRSSRHFKYCYTDEVLVHRRLVEGSMSTGQYKRKSNQMRSTLEVCKKIKGLNRSKKENKALRKRIHYEMRQCVKLADLGLFSKYLRLLFNS